MAITKGKKRISKEARISNEVRDVVKSIAVRKLIEKGYNYREVRDMMKFAESMVGKVEKRTDEEIVFSPGKKVVLDPVKHKRITPRDLNALRDAWAEALANPENARFAMTQFRPAGPEREVAVRLPKARKEKLSTYDVKIGGKSYAVAIRKDLKDVVEKPKTWMERTRAYQLRAALLSRDVIAITTGKGKTLSPRDFLSMYNKVFSPLLRRPGLTPADIYQKISIHKRRAGR